MVEAIRAGSDRVGDLAGRLRFAETRAYAPAALMGVLCLAALILTMERVGALQSWSERFDGRADYQVHSCSARTGLGADQWICNGVLTSDDPSPERRPHLITSLGAASSHRPYVGQPIEVFYAPDDPVMVYPVDQRLNELTALYLSLLPRILLLGGSALWLLGWALTRGLDPEDFVSRDAVRLPGRFTWRARGVTWILVGVVALALNHLLITRVIGSLGIV